MQAEDPWDLVELVAGMLPPPPADELHGLDAGWESLMVGAARGLARRLSFNRACISTLLDRDAAERFGSPTDGFRGRRVLLRLTLLAARHHHRDLDSAPLRPAHVLRHPAKSTTGSRRRTEKLTALADAIAR